jgi:NADPH2:quinone reductase
MKAIRVHQFGGPEVLRLEDLPDLRPGPGEVLIWVKAAGVNPVDTYVRSGNYGEQPFPYTPGSDAGGIVEAVGEGVARFRPGERVYTSGTITGAYAERALADAKRVHSLPEKLSFAQGAAIGVPYATAYRALFQRGRALPGESVLVHGASGGVGTAAVQLARAHGLTVFATAGTPQGEKLVMEQGAHHVLNHRGANYLNDLMKLTGGAGVNLILEMLANVNLGKDLTVLAPKGRVVVIGSRGRVEIDPRDAMRRDAAILGMVMPNATDTDRFGIFAALTAGLENGTLRPVVGREVPLAEAARAHQMVMEPGAHGKIVLVT